MNNAAAFRDFLSLSLARSLYRARQPQELMRAAQCARAECTARARGSHSWLRLAVCPLGRGWWDISLFTPLQRRAQLTETFKALASRVHSVLYTPAPAPAAVALCSALLLSCLLSCSRAHATRRFSVALSRTPRLGQRGEPRRLVQWLAIPVACCCGPLLCCDEAAQYDPTRR